MQKIKPGAKIRVYEGKTPFEGLVLARKHGLEAGGTFTVRAIVAGVGVEKVYPVHSPAIVKIQIVSSPKKVRRAKLYFIREKAAKAVHRQLRNARMLHLKSDETVAPVEAAPEIVEEKEEVVV